VLARPAPRATGRPVDAQLREALTDGRRRPEGGLPRELALDEGAVRGAVLQVESVHGVSPEVPRVVGCGLLAMIAYNAVYDVKENVYDAAMDGYRVATKEERVATKHFDGGQLHEALCRAFGLDQDAHGVKAEVARRLGVARQRYGNVLATDGHGNTDTVIEWCALAGVDIEKRHDEPLLRFVHRG